MREIDEPRYTIDIDLIVFNDVAQSWIPRRGGAGWKASRLYLWAQLMIAMTEGAVQDTSPNRLGTRRIPDCIAVLFVEVARSLSQPVRTAEIDAAVFGKLKMIKGLRAEAIFER